MEETRKMIEVLQELNVSKDRRIAQFTPALIGMIGSAEMFNVLLAELDEALAQGNISEGLRKRVRNLAQTFVPQVAGLNSIDDIRSVIVSVQELESIGADTPLKRHDGVKTILAALLTILTEVEGIPRA